jgi:Tfp pilus assembly protein PilO
MKDSIRIKKIRNRIIILGVVVLALIGGYYFLYSSQNSMWQTTATTESSNASLKLQKQNAVALESQYDGQAANRAKIQTYFVQKDGEADFIKNIESLADASSLDHTISSVGFENGNLPANLQYLNLTITTQGSWQNTYQFLSLVENMPYKIVMKNVDLSATGDSGSLSTSTAQSLGSGESVWAGSFDIDAAALQ